MWANKDHHNPCLNCMLSPLLWFGRLCGFVPLRFKCNTKERPCEFNINWMWAMLSFVNCTVMIVMIVLSIREFINSHAIVPDEDPTELVEQVVITIDITNQIASILLILINLMQARLRSKALNKIALIIYTKRFGINRVISRDHSKKIYYSGLRYVALIIVLVLFQILFTIYFILNEHIQNFWLYVVKTVYFSMSNTIYIITGMEFNLLTAIIKYMIYETYTELKSVLIKSRSSLKNKESTAAKGKSNNSNKIKFIPNIRVQPHLMAEVSMSGDVLTKTKSPEFCDQIGNLRLSYCAIYVCLKMLNHFMNPQLIVLTILVMFSIVLNSYLIIQFLIMQRIRILFIVTIIRLFVVVGVYIYMVLQAENLYRCGDMIFQLVVSSKTSQYSLHEMTQLEMLIKQIHGNPPQFTALDIFNINAGILDTMFGTVITYILVALQFKMTEVK